MVMRIGGLASGLDTDSTIKQLLTREQARVDKVKGQKQVLQWQQEMYRDLTGEVNKFKSKYFDVLNRGTYALSDNFFSSFKSSVVGADSGAVNITPGNTAKPGNYKVEVLQNATGAKVEGELKRTDGGKEVNIGTTLSNLGIKNGELKIKVGTDSAVPTEVPITIDNTKTIGDLVKDINSKLNGKVKASFSEISGKFSIETVQTGSNQKLEISGEVDTALNISVIKNPVTGANTGNDAEINVTLPGETTPCTIKKSTNNFTVDGINFDIKAKGSTTFNVESNVDKAVENIKELVKGYNDLIDGIASKVYQKKQYKYSPLTDEQKKDMKEDEIKKWEEKCKEGIIRNDPSLEKLLLDMRQAFTVGVTGVNINLKDIGIDTSSDYSQRGKLSINEEKLRGALTNRPDDVAALFTKDDPSIPYDKDKGYSGNTARKGTAKDGSPIGILRRIDDIMQDAIRTGRDSSGRKGALIEKAGITGDLSDIKNSITDKIKSKDEMIRDLIRKMDDKEKKLYQQFTRLETMMNKYNAQSNWLTQQLGGM